MDNISGISYYLNKCQTLSNTSQMTFFFSGRQRIGAHALRMQHSPTAAVLSTSFFLNHSPSNSPELNALITRFRESYSSVSQKYWRNQGATRWILSMHWYSIWMKKWNFCVSPFCQVV